MQGMIDQLITDLEDSRDNQWASGDRDFALMNDAKAAILREQGAEEEEEENQKVTELRSSWAFGSYHEDMGGVGAHYRERYACLAIKKVLVYLRVPGFDRINLETSRYGGATTASVKAFQRQAEADGHSVGAADGVVGKKTANYLFGLVAARIATEIEVKTSWLRGQMTWESGCDPGAENTNSDGSVDRGLPQVNSKHDALTQDQAYDPVTALTFLARFHADAAAGYADCQVDEWELAVARWRSPKGSDYWCSHPEVQPINHFGDGTLGPSASAQTWAEQDAFYVSRVAGVMFL